jgi:hypothetical protein
MAPHRLASVGSDIRFYPDDDQIAKVAAVLRLAILSHKFMSHWRGVCIKKAMSPLGRFC